MVMTGVMPGEPSGTFSGEFPFANASSELCHEDEQVWTTPLSVCILIDDGAERRQGRSCRNQAGRDQTKGD